MDVTIELLDTDISAFQVVHLDDQSGSAETLPAEGNSGSVTFSTDHFSVFGFGGIFRGMFLFENRGQGQK